MTTTEREAEMGTQERCNGCGQRFEDVELYALQNLMLCETCHDDACRIADGEDSEGTEQD